MIFEKVKSVIAEQTGIDPETITMESSFVEDLNIDSIDLIELIMMLEEEYNIEFSEDDAETIKTIGDVVNYINRNC